MWQGLTETPLFRVCQGPNYCPRMAGSLPIAPPWTRGTGEVLQGNCGGGWVWVSCAGCVCAGPERIACVSFYNVCGVFVGVTALLAKKTTSKSTRDMHSTHYTRRCLRACLHPLPLSRAVSFNQKDTARHFTRGGVQALTHTLATASSSSFPSLPHTRGTQKGLHVGTVTRGLRLYLKHVRGEGTGEMRDQCECLSVCAWEVPGVC